MNRWEQVKRWYRKLPDKKRYFEFITALLSIPVLLTVLILNIGSLKNKNVEKKDDLQRVTIVPVQVTATDKKPLVVEKVVSEAACVRKVGPIEIVSPKQNETVGKDPVCIDIAYEEGDYCGVVWSYRINGSDWSDYNDKSICLYGLPSGEKEFELRVKSIAGEDEKYLTRTFIYSGKEAITPISTPTPIQ